MLQTLLGNTNILIALGVFLVTVVALMVVVIMKGKKEEPQTVAPNNGGNLAATTQTESGGMSAAIPSDPTAQQPMDQTAPQNDMMTPPQGLDMSMSMTDNTPADPMQMATPNQTQQDSAFLTPSPDMNSQQQQATTDPMQAAQQPIQPEAQQQSTPVPGADLLSSDQTQQQPTMPNQTSNNAVIPGMQPMDFGMNQQQAGMPPGPGADITQQPAAAPVQPQNTMEQASTPPTGQESGVVNDPAQSQNDQAVPQQSATQDPMQGVPMGGMPTDQQQNNPIEQSAPPAHDPITGPTPTVAEAQPAPVQSQQDLNQMNTNGAQVDPMGTSPQQDQQPQAAPMTPPVAPPLGNTDPVQQQTNFQTVVASDGTQENNDPMGVNNQPTQQAAAPTPPPIQ
ncbi:hypothetical protein KC717_05295 [Candidatus Dojkabacteria bacterium]|uniref:Uncharacterized protein n=1 Tax=Candidatus Dojkabacteria bacterium TaxID=2099670 RepID=A0A955RKQ3_9BACT|nr:hypothetical protein [Candidatus Dojkabacteria bacterium]